MAFDADLPDEPLAQGLGRWVDRFRKDLELIDDLDPALLKQPGGIAVSGGPDSMALMWLMYRIRHGGVRVVSLDHKLRPESAEEVRRVAAQARLFGLPHDILMAEWPDGPPAANIQDEARKVRYHALARWAAEHNIAWIMTAHHADDQAETMVMRLVRGSGLSGLSGIRRMRRAGPAMLVRPLLDWRKAELHQLCEEAKIPVSLDPSNEDERYDRTRMRNMLGQPGMPDAVGLAATADRLAGADEALAWATDQVVRTRCSWPGDGCRFDVADLPDELVRRALVQIVAHFGGEVRGQVAHRAMLAARRGEVVTLGAVQLRPGETWLLRKLDTESSPITA